MEKAENPNRSEPLTAMNIHHPFSLLRVLALLLSTIGVVSAQSTAFTYQGQLTDGGTPASGLFDLRFTVHDAPSGGSLIGGPVDVGDVSVTNGLFTVIVDLGSTPFAGGARWLEIGVRPGASTGAYSILASRQAITATPYAIRAAEAMRVPNGAITSPMLADGGVTAAKVAPGAVSLLWTGTDASAWGPPRRKVDCMWRPATCCLARAAISRSKTPEA